MEAKHTAGLRCKDCKWVHEADSEAKTSFMGVELCSLHSSAPELLEALKVAREWMGSNVAGKLLDKAQAEIDAVIAKAEGRA